MFADQTSPKSFPGNVLHEANEFYLRLNIGYGIPKGNLGYADGSITTIENGSAGYFTLHLGYGILNNFIVFLEVGTTATNNSMVLENSVATGKKLEKFNVPAFGLGTTFYLMPLNIYISPVVRIPQLLYDLNLGNAGYDRYASDFGIGFSLSAGIELMVADTWATGLGINFSYDIPTPLKNYPVTTIDQIYIGLGATLTYN